MTKRTEFPWSIRPYREGDENGIVELLNLAWKARFGKWHDLPYWHWKYKQNPAGHPIVWIAELEDKIIGHYGIVPVIMKVGNTYMTGSFSGDAATHTNYQGRGVFSSIVNRSYADAAEKGITITYGFANTTLPAIYKRYEQRGYICFIQSITKLLGSKTVRKQLKSQGQIGHERNTGPLRIEKINRFDQRIDTFWKTISNYFPIIVRRNQQYLNWRYTSNPEKEYLIYTAKKDDQILGYCVLDEMQSQKLRLGAIVDILASHDQPRTLEYLLATAVQILRERGVDAIFSMISEEHRYNAAFRKAGFVPHPRHRRALYAALNLNGSHLNELEVYTQALALSQNSFLKKKSNWHMMFGDGSF